MSFALVVLLAEVPPAWFSPDVGRLCCDDVPAGVPLYAAKELLVILFHQKDSTAMEKT